jgi:hypothetical protein
MKGFRYPGVSDRLGQALREIGYVRDDGKLDLMRFAREHGFQYLDVYPWLAKGTTPSYENTLRLAAALGKSPAWILLGDTANDVPAPPTTSTRSRRVVKAALAGAALAAGVLGMTGQARAVALPSPGSHSASYSGVTDLSLIGS